jgi:hypothetical protein
MEPQYRRGRMRRMHYVSSFLSSSGTSSDHRIGTRIREGRVRARQQGHARERRR